MSKFAQKVGRIPKVLYEHKKKTVFFSFCGYLAGDWVYRWSRNQTIRAEYSKIARIFGEKTISPEDRPRRIFVLINTDANLRNVVDNFTKNALPLFHLAGISVDIVKAKDEKQMEQLAGALDQQEADAIYVVGGDGAIGKVVSGIFKNREKSILPIGFYPGGYDNAFLKRIAPEVFANSQDVRAACESAMAVIEEQKRNLYAFEVKNAENDEIIEYGLSDLSMGWNRQIEEVRKKMWYFGGLRRRWAYIWEMCKRSPSPIELQIEYEQPCSGCQKCRPKPIILAPTWRWWHILTGTPKYRNSDAERDFTGIINEKCGEWQKMEAKGSEILIENQQNTDHSSLRLRISAADSSRLSVISDGFSARIAENHVGSSRNPDYYPIDISANSVRFKIAPEISDYIRKMWLSSIPTDKSAEICEKWWEVRGSLKKLECFLPKNVRLQEF
ncbi:unnamed protein product [Caenorhabditis angaria]|uniref:DAGKc domain-containing protein n=1 Tax=Caenorhabditis angaria TaxID=860376 RepID=A0A9P1IIY7_9PELO|nr:unnamed protein product [Caenorhabditis angaria]